MASPSSCSLGIARASTALRSLVRRFRILEDTKTKATFFIIGWIAKTYPELVRRIADKYQIGCHTMNHQLVWQQTPAEFREDVETGVKMLEDITGKKVECFRAPGFSIRESEAWAFEILHELGIKYDSSVFPAPASHGGMPKYGAAVPSIVEVGGVQMKEFPIPYHKEVGRHVVFNGGGYFRLFPYSLIRKWTKETAVQGSRLTVVESATPRHSSSELGSAHGSNADFKVQGGQDIICQTSDNSVAYTRGIEEELFKVGFCLPAGPYVTDDDVRYIVECIKEAIVG